MSIVTVGIHTYDIGRMDALKQFHVVRRLAPLVASSGAAFLSLAKFGSQSADQMAALLQPVISELALLPDAEADYVIFACLGVTRRRDATGGFSPMVTSGTNALMYQDLSMEDMLQLIFKVLQENLSSFFASLGELTPSPGN